MKSPRLIGRMALAAFVMIIVFSLLSPADAAMSDYCITPPFVVAGVKPNLLLMLDNSASMYDLQYVDKGTLTRDPTYCYDETYKSTVTYVGYFESERYYEYDFTNQYFKTPVTSAVACSKSIPGTLCIHYTAAVPPVVDGFWAKGNYLNWLSASKYDEQKKILTGGKFDDTNKFLIEESRGCVGRKFVKEALTGDYVEGAVNTALGITFGVRGPVDDINKTQPSPGGQTYIDIFYGDYNAQLCQDAINAFEAGQLGPIKQAVDACLGATGTVPGFCSALPTRACAANNECYVDLGTCQAGAGGNKFCSIQLAGVNVACKNNAACASYYVGPCVTQPQTVETKQKVVFNQSLQACWAYLSQGKVLGIDELNTVHNQCPDIFKGNDICVGGTNNGKKCSVAADCPLGTCKKGPTAIFPGNPGLLCSSDYTGFCASSGDNWVTTTWIANGYATADDCILTKHKEFCNVIDIPDVIDPTDSPSATETYGNLPAIISDIGVEAQLSQPIGTLRARIKYAVTDMVPSGLLQEYSNLIRFGMMHFNFNGSASELAVLPAPKICSVTTTRLCSTNLDCPSTESCIATVTGTTNQDGGAVKHYIGLGKCSLSVGTSCTKDSQCPAGEDCVSDGVGDHVTGLIKKIDDIRAATWTPFSEAFYNAIGYYAKTDAGISRTDLRLNASDFDEIQNPSEYKCQKNNILLITDGMSTADRNPQVSSLAGIYTNSGTATTCPEYAGSNYIENLAWIGHERKISTFSKAAQSAEAPKYASDNITTYVVFAGASNGGAGSCNSETLMQNTAAKGGGTYSQAEDPTALREALSKTFQDISKEASSGTAASVLASGEGSGANLVQALFYPARFFGSPFCSITTTKNCSVDTDCPVGEQCVTTQIEWTGSLQNYWYYIDPFFGNASIREDTNSNRELDMTGDHIIHFRFVNDPTDPNYRKTVADLYSDSDGDGDADSLVESKLFEDIGYLWESGRKLHATSPADRTIFTSTTGTNTVSFVPSLSLPLADYLAYLQVPNQGFGDRIVNYARGTDYNKLFCSLTVAQSCTRDADCPAGERCIRFRNRTVTIDGTTNTWKLGDIVNSTPRILSGYPLNFYYKTYLDKTYNEFTSTTAYKNRGMVFVGANDGMLHAFKLGRPKVIEEKLRKAQLQEPEGEGLTDLGEEAWAFVPRHALPYLKYLADPNYCHLYYADAQPYILDASIGCSSPDYWNCDKNVDSWRTILIGGMRFGGACKNVATTLGVQVPAVDKGLSSYFALDITDPKNPQVLWEFSDAILGAADKGLGFATTGPAIVRISAKKADGTSDKDKNGRWYAVFASGPTGPIDTPSHQFKGYSDQPLKVYVVDLASGDLVRTITPGINNGFAGSLVGAAIDFDQNDTTRDGFYQDDALYFGFTKAEASPLLATTKWNVGGVLRLVTKEDNPDSGAANWALSTLISGIGPVPAAVVKTQNYKSGSEALWVSFGTGRYYFKIADAVDDATNGRSLYGLKEPCFTSTGFNKACTLSTSRAALGNANSGSSSDSDGWYIDLDSCTDENGSPISCADPTFALFKAERNVTDPLATPLGVVFFTTTKPTGDVCEFGGSTHLWAVRYDTGGAPKSGVLKGKALIQVSTGSIEERDLSTAFTEREGRRTTAIQGVPPAGSPPGILLPPKPMNKFIHIKER